MDIDHGEWFERTANEMERRPWFQGGYSPNHDEEDDLSKVGHDLRKSPDCPACALGSAAVVNPGEAAHYKAWYWACDELGEERDLIFEVNDRPGMTKERMVKLMRKAAEIARRT